MKIQVTKASKKDGNKFTVRSSELGLNGVFQSGVKIVITIKGNGKKTHDVVLTSSRNGTTFYGECPTKIKMPSIGKPKYIEIIKLSSVVKYV